MTEDAMDWDSFYYGFIIALRLVRLCGMIRGPLV